MLKKDIENREDVYKIVKEFYVKLMNDEVMIHFFKELKPKILSNVSQMANDSCNGDPLVDHVCWIVVCQTTSRLCE